MEDDIFVQILILSLFTLHPRDHVLGHTDRVFITHSQSFSCRETHKIIWRAVRKLMQAWTQLHLSGAFWNLAWSAGLSILCCSLLPEKRGVSSKVKNSIALLTKW